MLACIFGRRGRQEGYAELVYEDKMALYSDNEPYLPHNTMSYYYGQDHGYGTTAPLTDNSSATDNKDMRSVDDIAEDVARLLWEAEWNDDALQCRISEAVGERRWNRKMVEACLDRVIEYVEQGRFEMGDAMCAALDKATDIADDEFAFPRRHPQSLDGFIAIVSVGVLAELQGAWVLELLGFGEVRGKEELDGTGEIAMLTSDKIVFGTKPRSNSFAAWWARDYDAYIPSGAVYSYLRRMDMVDRQD
ncbi:hypothetical protein NEMBOFW57_006361 [Staphylotrichum longicolle]|uniref:Uncharacterized protein n=1 Tax=Staphylotrichum longicolle TaxID=669026 RepID=A0AAD4HZE3_9PEZI|nr:hypothetical protein NEMBOFW57_006361 [Staphylotrichum longicolle]